MGAALSILRSSVVRLCSPLIIESGKAIFQAIFGDWDTAKKILTRVRYFYSKEIWRILGETIDGIPIAGHIKGLVHLFCGEEDKFFQSFEIATTMTAVILAGPLTVALGGNIFLAGLAGFAVGIVADCVTTGIETYRYGQFEPQGVLKAYQQVLRAFEMGEGRVDSILELMMVTGRYFFWGMVV